MSSILYILIALVMLGIIIFIHEFGHFLVGRLMGIGVIEFSIGMGPKIIGWKGRKRDDAEPTAYSFRAIPLGGYCAFEGEDGESAGRRAMNNQPAWKRALTVAAGPFMNLLLAFVIAAAFIAGGKIYDVYSEPQVVPYVGELVENMPAERAGILPGDVITSVNGSVISFDENGYNTLKEAITGCEEGEALSVEVTRGEGETRSFEIVPEYDEEGNLLLGVRFSMAYRSYDCNLLGAMPEALSFMWNTAKATYNALIGLIRDLFMGNHIEEGTVSGVVGIVSAVSGELKVGFAEKFSSGMFALVYYVMAISLSLGIMNLLPLPALDGGRLILLIIEAVTGKHLKRETEGKINLIALLLLVALMLLITFFDVKSLIR